MMAPRESPFVLALGRDEALWHAHYRYDHALASSERLVRRHGQGSRQSSV
jgi:hypothetical protein